LHGNGKREREIICDKAYSDLTEAAINFLEAYSNFTKKDYSKLIDMVVASDTSKDSTVTIENLRFNITKTFDKTIERTVFCSTDTFNGVTTPF
jgi:hypothetical protein